MRSAVAAGLLVPLLLVGAAAATGATGGTAAPPVSTSPPTGTPAPTVSPAVSPGPDAGDRAGSGTPAGTCIVLGTSRAGRAWLPRAHVLVLGGPVDAVRVLTADARVSVTGARVEVQRTSRVSAAAVAPVVLEVAVSGSTVTCTVPVTG